METTDKSNWYQEPWVWFNLLLLSIAIGACIFMTILSLKHTPPELNKNWYDEGILMTQLKKTEPSIRALGLSGSLKIALNDEISFELKTLAPSNMHESSLTLYIEHPSNPSLDQTILLKEIKNNIYQGKLTHSLYGKQYLLISNKANEWNLVSEGYFPTNTNLQFMMQ